jgi:mannan endo-1,4-beta-mannosidase
MKILLFKAKLILSGLLLFCLASLKAQTYPGYQVKGRFLYDRCGEKVILRGVNEMFRYSSDIHGTITLPEIAKTGANVARLMWLPDGASSDLEKLIANCISNQLIPMPELHGATGKWTELTKQVDYWVRQDVVDVIKKYEKNLLVNIANEAGDGTVTDSQFRTEYKNAITRMRNAGIRTPLIIDASTWGQDENKIFNNAKWLISQDPQKNLIFSVHMYWTGTGADTRIINTIKKTVTDTIPFIVGEFAGPYIVNCGKEVPYKTIMKECQNNQVGWLAWSWGLVKNSDCNLMDMSGGGKFSTLNNWGLEAATTDPNSIKNTAKRPYSMISGTCPATDVRQKSADVLTINVYPNPAGKELYIDPAMGFLKRDLRILIIDASGREVFRSDAISQVDNQLRLNIEGLTGGLYCLILTSGELTIHKKFIKQ